MMYFYNNYANNRFYLKYKKKKNTARKKEKVARVWREGKWGGKKGKFKRQKIKKIKQNEKEIEGKNCAAFYLNIIFIYLLVVAVAVAFAERTLCQGVEYKTINLQSHPPLPTSYCFKLTLYTPQQSSFISLFFYIFHLFTVFFFFLIFPFIFPFFP